MRKSLYIAVFTSGLTSLAAEMAADFPEFEPPVLEFVVALGYLLLGSEALWIARLIVSLAWCLGGLALFALVKESVSGVPALVALGYYLFLPFGVTASRSFQPDPMMVMWVMLAAYALYRWSESQATSWRWTILAAPLLFAVAFECVRRGLPWTFEKSYQTKYPGKAFPSSRNQILPSCLQTLPRIWIR